MVDRSEEARMRAETKFEKTQKQTRESDKAWTQHLAADRAQIEKTARLRALRLAKEAADVEAGVGQAPVKKAPVRKKKVVAKAPAKAPKAAAKAAT